MQVFSFCWLVSPFRERNNFIRLSKNIKLYCIYRCFNRKLYLPLQNVSLSFILKIFLKFRKFQPGYSYKIYSCKKKKSVYIDLDVRIHTCFSHLAIFIDCNGSKFSGDIYRIQLNRDQQEILKFAAAGHNLLIMGQAGVGKSEVDKSSLTTPGWANYSCPTYHANRESVRFRWEQPFPQVASEAISK